MAGVMVIPYCPVVSDTGDVANAGEGTSDGGGGSPRSARLGAGPRAAEVKRGSCRNGWRHAPYFPVKPQFSTGVRRSVIIMDISCSSPMKWAPRYASRIQSSRLMYDYLGEVLDRNVAVF